MTEQEVLQTIKDAKRIAIFTHRIPDPDAYGSSFAMLEFCVNLGKDASVFAVKNEDCFMDKLFPLTKLKTDFHADEFDLVICLDMSVKTRLEKIFLSEIEKSKNILVIDHHHISPYEEPFTQNLYSFPKKSAACQVLTELFADNNIEITSRMATYLYAGIMGDTDRFLHTNVTPKVFECAKILMENGANVQFVYDVMYRNTTMKEHEIWKQYLNKLQLFENGRVAIVVFTLKDMETLDAGINDIKKYANDIVRIDGVESSILIIERGDCFKFSLRSRGSSFKEGEMSPSLRMAQKYGGGGHNCASAFDMKTTLDEVMKNLPNFAKELVN